MRDVQCFSAVPRLSFDSHSRRFKAIVADVLGRRVAELIRPRICVFFFVA